MRYLSSSIKNVKKQWNFISFHFVSVNARLVSAVLTRRACKREFYEGACRGDVNKSSQTSLNFVTL